MRNEWLTHVHFVWHSANHSLTWHSKIYRYVLLNLKRDNPDSWIPSLVEITLPFLMYKSAHLIQNSLHSKEFDFVSFSFSNETGGTCTLCWDISVHDKKYHSATNFWNKQTHIGFHQTSEYCCKSLEGFLRVIEMQHVGMYTRICFGVKRHWLKPLCTFGFTYSPNKEDPP